MKYRLADRQFALLTGLGAVGIACHGGISLLSKSMDSSTPRALSGVLAFLAIYAAAFVAYVLSVRLFASAPSERRYTVLAIALAAAMRLAAILGPPLFEDDIYRYEWDGAVTAHGMNPYRYAPSEVTLPPFDAMRKSNRDPGIAVKEMEELDRRNHIWFAHGMLSEDFARINYPDIATIYPPLAQLAFAATHLLAPRPTLVTTTYKAVFSALDLLAVMLIGATLARLGRKPGFCAIYGLSPLAVHEISGSGHMESLVVLCLAAGLYALVRERRLLALTSVAAAVLAKVYPIVLLPLFARMFARSDRRRWGLGLLVAATCLVLAYLPFVGAGAKLWSGSLKFAAGWEMNSGLFAVVSKVFAALLPDTALDTATIMARGVAGAALLVWISLVLRRSVSTFDDVISAAISIVGAVFLLSPVQNPWYLTWVLPLLCFDLRGSWIVLSGTISLYYVYLWLQMGGAAAAARTAGVTVDLGFAVIIAEYAPFAVLIVLETARHKSFWGLPGEGAETAATGKLRVSVVMPVLNEEFRIGARLREVSVLGFHEVIVVDGGSWDATRMLAASNPNALIVEAPRGRAAQMNEGAKRASGEVILFLHADVSLPADALTHIREVLAYSDTVAGAFRTWTVPDGPGRRPWWSPLLHLADIRSRYSRSPYGDQALFVRREAFLEIGCYPDIPVFEDLELSRRLSRLGRIRMARANVRVSGRRFLKRPLFYMTLVNIFPLLYRFGVPTQWLERLYGVVR
jgi:rSAM/selenodomain-associated transferase 2